MKYFIVAVCVVCMTGCEFFADPDTLIRTPSITFNSIDELKNYVTHELTYIPEFADRWQAPQETIDKGGGDCEDFAVFVGYFAERMGYEVYLVALETPRGNHMILTLNDVPYEPQTITYYSAYNCYPKIARFTMDEALRRCYFWYGSRSMEE